MYAGNASLERWLTRLSLTDTSSASGFKDCTGGHENISPMKGDGAGQGEIHLRSPYPQALCADGQELRRRRETCEPEHRNLPADSFKCKTLYDHHDI